MHDVLLGWPTFLTGQAQTLTYSRAPTPVKHQGVDTGVAGFCLSTTPPTGSSILDGWR